MQIISTIMGSIFEIYIAHTFFSKFGNMKYLPKKSSTFIILITNMLIISSFTFAGSAFVFVGFSICYFLYASLFQIKFSKKIVLALSLIITVALSEMIVVMTTTMGMDTSINSLQNNDIMYMICVIVAKFLAFAILKLIKKPSFNSSQKFPLWFNFGTSVLPFTSVFIIILLYRYSYIVNDITYQVSTLLAAVLLVIANLLILFVIDKQEIYLRTTERLLFAEAHIKNQLAHYSELYTQQESLKKFRHDSKNFYTSLISILETLSNQDAINYIKNKIDLDILNDNTINSGHPVIDAIIYSKMHQAQKLGASINSTIKITNKIFIDELELGVLIGNAIDNAIEAVGELNTSTSKIITLNIISSGDMLSIEISNPTNSNIDIRNLKTTKKDKRLHGYGLNGIETITNKYNGNLSISCENNIFTLSSILVNMRV